MPTPRRSILLLLTDGPDATALAGAVDGLADVVVARTAEAVDLLAARPVDVVIYDEATARPGARPVLTQAATLCPAAVRILLAAGHPDAHDRDVTVLSKPVAGPALRAVCAMALRCAAATRRSRTLVAEGRRLVEPAPVPASTFDDLGHVERYEALLTRSATMARVLALLQRIEAIDTALVIHGESGAGKTTTAAAIHTRSRRADGPFVIARLGNLSDRARESLLLGHRAGAGPDGPERADGRLLEADGGTLFVDDIADASPSLQLALLRVLDDGTFLPVGADRPCRVRVRILAGTRRSLDELVRQGLFRRDLHERLRAAAVTLPALRDRPEDVILLARQMLAQASAAMGRKAPGISREARAALETYHWPGNARELRNLMERAVILCKGGLVIAADLPIGWSRPATEPGLPIGALSIAIPPGGASLKQLEREIFVKTLALAGGNQSRAAHILGLCESTFRFRLHKLGIASRRTPSRPTQPAAGDEMVVRA